MFKNFVKIILVGALFVGTFFVVGSVKAIDCCLIQEVSTKEGVSTKKEIDCRLMGSVPCDTSFKKGICPVEEEIRGRAGDEVSVCPVSVPSTQEEKIDCKDNLECKKRATEAVVDCTSIKIPDDCKTVGSLCFWSPNSRKCFSVSDVNNCPGFSKDDCGKVPACTWEPPNDPNGSCLDPLSKGMRKQYGESRGDILPSCAASGQCRSLSNILSVVLNIVKLVFRYVGAIAFIFFVYGGFTMILSFGNSEKFKKGQQVLVAAVIGLIIVFGAYLMITFVLEALGVSEAFKAIK